ncbi:DUF3592 domain-containing protein [Kineosporia sp. J2-2]|uniref:DUF3592 domain-containing protein n=1 Tax=Kineosporia corallincola TaxID=2835133 RepID=A0ABS5TR46_9ACTN|nr:DUF3592 domain-containing protein [Kineosporia corallincola]MBT0772644.1 DUF3592 domain-containing protein [Kineosporia corallincola]
MYDTGDTMLMMRVVLGALVLLCVAVGLLRRRRQDDLRRSWPQVPGEVVGTRAPIGGGARHQPVIRYRTQEGETITLIRESGVSIATPVTGRRVPVWYDPADPQRFRTQVYPVDRHGSFSFGVAVLLAVIFLVAWL